MAEIATDSVDRLSHQFRHPGNESQKPEAGEQMHEDWNIDP